MGIRRPATIDSYSCFLVARRLRQLSDRVPSGTRASHVGHGSFDSRVCTRAWWRALFPMARRPLRACGALFPHSRAALHDRHVPTAKLARLRLVLAPTRTDGGRALVGPIWSRCGTQSSRQVPYCVLSGSPCHWPAGDSAPWVPEKSVALCRRVARRSNRVAESVVARGAWLAVSGAQQISGDWQKHRA